ncbi:integration host factor, actinobacterial type [Streptomyces sp. ISL-100]|uniref:integration host factor, actinobacterial type n=1 Tax=Streptomyces sp. ISL-100 TaxID=2819173 RepID=UPI001BEB2C03|nr:integration host factor, actinobacterial type [Streptomyces sp. ISL-100]MBT2401963.1 integration host factor [Streptomyces sp. ISL-100]
MALPPLSKAQRAAALEKAAAARTERAEVKDALKRGALSLGEVVADPSKSVGKMPVHSLLAALPGIGKIRAMQIMKELGISESRRVRGLGSNQKELLLARFAPQG